MFELIAVFSDSQCNHSAEAEASKHWSIDTCTQATESIHSCKSGCCVHVHVIVVLAWLQWPLLVIVIVCQTSCSLIS